VISWITNDDPKIKGDAADRLPKLRSSVAADFAYERKTPKWLTLKSLKSDRVGQPTRKITKAINGRSRLLNCAAPRKQLKCRPYTERFNAVMHTRHPLVAKAPRLLAGRYDRSTHLPMLRRRNVDCVAVSTATLPRKAACCGPAVVL
jgi:hypothetical protein